MKKIGILTFHYANNYGAVLQTYALYTSLLNLGYCPTIINRIPSKSSSLARRLKNGFNNMFESYFSSSFSSFRNEYFNSITEVVDSTMDMKAMNSLFDTIIVGSDQVWRLDYTRGLGYNYFLDFVNEKVRKVSYATSFGKDSFQAEQSEKEQICNLLKRFNYISVREDSGVGICQSEFNVQAQHVLDPTLLLGNYDSIIGKKDELTNRKYIATYFLDTNDYKTTLADQLSLDMNTELNNIYRTSSISFSLKNFSFPLSDYIYPEVSTWLSGIKNSKFIITDSFHGVAFSILFNKQFVCIGNKARGLSRMSSLLKMFDLEDRMVLEDDKLDFETLVNVNYEKVNAILKVKRKKSVDFLISSISQYK